MLRDFGIALSIANVTFLRIWWELLTYSRADMFYVKTAPPTSVLTAAVLGVLVLSLAIFAVMLILRIYVSNPVVHIGIGAATALLFVVPALSLLFSASNRYPYIRELPLRLLGQRTAIVVGVCAFILIAYAFVRTRPAAIMLVLLPFVPVTFSQAIWKAIKYDARLYSDKPLAPFLRGQEDGPRVLWVIFDRMDQRLSFDNRPATVQLPEFDRLRNETVHARNAVPPAPYTLYSMPALIYGRLLRFVKNTDIDEFSIRFDDDGSQSIWGSQGTIFSDVRAAGLNSGIVGWYLPYCRVLNQSVSACEWFDMDRQHNSYDFNNDNPAAIPSIMLNQFRSLYETNLLSPFGQSLPTLKHAQTYRTILAEGRQFAVDTRLNVVLLHFPIPHWPYFYNRKTGADDLGNSLVYGYLDALNLADITLGTIRRDLEQAGLWDRTTVLVSSDHSHRMGATAIDGKMDPRVPFLLKLPGQTVGVEYANKFNTLVTKDILLAVLRGEVTTPKHVTEWLDRHRSIGERSQVIHPE
jgi:hypothetical protein